MTRSSTKLGFLRTTAIGGLLFLLPLIVAGALIGQIVPILLAITRQLGEILPGFAKTPAGIGLLVVLSILVLLGLCFAAGILARRSFIKNLSVAFEKKLLLLFPRYAILKDQMADSIGGEQNRPQMKPVLVRFDGWMRVAFETERSPNGGWVSVYLPGSPDPWAGYVVVVEASRVTALSADFGTTVACYEQMGRGATSLVEQATAVRANLPEEISGYADCEACLHGLGISLRMKSSSD